jgi:hypothetical protein
MRTRFFAGVAAVLALVWAAHLAAFQPNTYSVALDTAYATFQQPGLQALDKVVEHDDLGLLPSELSEVTQRMVLCVGADVSAAVRASAVGFALPDEEVPVVAGSSAESLWVAAYLGGDGSTPPAYQVRAIDVLGRTIRVSYERVEAATRSCDLLAYIVWAPVSYVEPAEYTLELFDAVANEVTYSRAWRITVR